MLQKADSNVTASARVLLVHFVSLLAKYLKTHLLVFFWHTVLFKNIILKLKQVVNPET